jgi:hypothetical protein
MFETAILRKHGNAFTSIDKGLIAETLLFYSNVHVVAHFGVLIDLLRAFGADTLLRLIGDKIPTLTYLRTDFATLIASHPRSLPENAIMTSPDPYPPDLEVGLEAENDENLS